MNTGRIGYVLKVFPRVSETFVINEIRTLEDFGDPLCVFSLHHNDAVVPHHLLDELRSPLQYVDDGPPPSDAAVGRARRHLERHFAVPQAQVAAVLPRKYVRLAVSLATAIEAHGVAHLHAHFAARAGHVAVLAAALAGCRYSITAHAKDIYHRDVDPQLLRWKILHAAFVVTVTDYNLHYLRALVADCPAAAEKIVRVYNGVDLRRFSPSTRSPVAPPLLLGVGRLVEKKGFAVLVDACRRLRQRGYDFRCAIIGEGPEDAALRAQIDAAKLEGTVTLRGVLATEAVAAAVSTAAAVVLPCVVAHDGNVDALPTVLLEAAATACPVVSTRLSGIPEIVVDGYTGLLVEPGDPDALAAALASLLDQPERARLMGDAGRRRAEQLFDLHANVAQLRRHFALRVSLRAANVPEAG